MDPTIETLRNHPLCEGLQEEELARLARHATPISLPAGANIYRSGQPIEAVHMLVSGRARLTVLVPGKAANLELESGPGDEVLGAVALLESGASLGDMVAVEPVRLLSIPREPFLDLLQSIPSLALHLIRRLARRTMQIAGVERPRPRALTVGVIWKGPRGRSLLDLLGRELAARGERVPRKSTSFAPKPRTGLVLRSFAQGRIGLPCSVPRPPPPGNRDDLERWWHD